MNDPFSKNVRVRLVGDPTRIGMLTGLIRPGRPGRGDRHQVKFPDATDYIPGDQLEVLPDRENPVDLLRHGKLGRAADLRRALTHVRLTGRLADVIYSMEMTNTDFYPYQFKPVLRFLNSPSNALLIADEVGLGKTIEAGLVWTELRSRYDLKRLVILCPAMLREKWQRELAQKIGVRSLIVDADELLKALRSPDASSNGFALICSQQGARPGKGWDVSDDAEPTRAANTLARFLRSKESEDPLIDLLIVDEAHEMRNPETQTHEMGHLFRAVSENLLLLTATPIHNYNQDLHALLKLLDPDTFQREQDLRSILDASRPLVEARDHILSTNPLITTLEPKLIAAESHPLLHGNRQLSAIRQILHNPDCLADRSIRADLARRLELVNPLAYVITRTRKRDVKEWRVIRDPQLQEIDMTKAEKEFYDAVTGHVVEYAMSLEISDSFVLSTPQRQMSSSMAATLRAWRSRRDNVDELNAAKRGDGSKPEMGPLTRSILEHIDDFGSLDELLNHDSKLIRLKEMLRHYFTQHPTEKVVLFSTFRETLNYLGEQLAASGITNLIMHGGSTKPKDEILQQFREDPNIRILLSSEIGSEGIDLQFCRVLVNYDLPWNPMRLEQRIGRLDRLGQAANRILVWNLIYADTIDSRIYTRLYEKLDLCRQALGDFEEVLGNKIRELTLSLLSDHLTPEQQIRRIDQTAQALENLKKEQEQLEGEAAHLVAYGDYIMQQVHAAREMHRHIAGDDLRTYVTDFFRMNYPGCDFHQLRAGDPDYEIRLSPEARHDLDTFVRSKRLSTETRLIQSNNKSVACRFENRTTNRGGSGHELINQFHPLVRFVSSRIADSQEQLSPAVSIKLPASVLQELPGDSLIGSGDYVLSASRWWVDGLQTTEKMVYAAAKLHGGTEILAPADAERLAGLAARSGQDWFEAGHQVDLSLATDIADQRLFSAIDEEYEIFVSDIRNQNEDRAELQMRNLHRHLEGQRGQMLQTRERHRMLGRESLVKATDGRIAALENRVDQQKVKIERRRQIGHRKSEVLVAVIRIDAKSS